MGQRLWRTKEPVADFSCCMPFVMATCDAKPVKPIAKLRLSCLPLMSLSQ